MKSSFQKELKKRTSTAMSLCPASLCLCSFTCVAVGIPSLWDSAPTCGLPMEAPSFDTAGYSIPLGILGIRGRTSLMIDYLNEKNDDLKKPMHEMRPLWKCTGSAHSPQGRIESPVKWNIKIARFREKKSIQSNENIHLFPGKGLLYYTSLKWSKWGESDVKGNVLVLQRVPLQSFIAHFNDCICSPKMNVVYLTSKSWCAKLFLFARDDYAKELVTTVLLGCSLSVTELQTTVNSNRFLILEMPFLHASNFVVMPA